MRNKCFNLHQFRKEAGVKDIPGLSYNPEPVVPYDWNSQGATNEERIQKLKNDFYGFLTKSEAPMADSYGALQKRPFQEGYGSKEHMLPVHNLYRQLEAYAESLPDEERKQFLNLWNGDLRNAIAPALSELGIPYNPALFDAFSQRMTSGKLNNLFEQPSEQIKLVAENHRKSWIRTFQTEVMHVYNDLVSKYNITPGEFTHLCYLGEVNPNKPPTNLQFAGDGPRGYLVEKMNGLGEIARATGMLNWILYEHPRQLQASSDETRRINHLFSGLNERPGDRDIYPNASPITRDEILAPLGFTMAVYPPNKPSWEIEKSKIPYEKASVKSLTDEQKAEREAAWEQQRLNPNNLEVLRRYVLDGGFEYGGLGALLNTGQKDIAHGDDFDNDPDSDVVVGERRYPARVLKYIFDQLCQRNKKSFREMLEASGLGYLNEDLDQTSYPDPAFTNFNLVFRSQAEQDVVNKLRKFGLMAVPMPISIPSPSDCVVNPRSFDIDFTIPCDVLRTWNMKYGQAHPDIQQTVIFVGEYFGFDRKQMITIPTGQEWKNPDGSVAKFTDSDGNSVDASGGNNVERGFKYKVSTQWKKVCETYVSHMMGNATIFIEKDSKDRDIMSQLDNNHIIYNSNECGDLSCCISVRQMEQHISTCNDPECPSRRYVSNTNGKIVFQPKEYSRAEAYIISCLEDLKVKYGFAPTAKQDKSVYDSKEMYEYYTLYQKRTQSLSILWKQYEDAIHTNDNNKAEALLNQYNTIRDGIASLQERYMSKLKESYSKQLDNPMYKLRENGLKTLLDIYKQSNGTIQDRIIAKACSEYMSANPPTQIPAYVLEINQVQIAN